MANEPLVEIQDLVVSFDDIPAVRGIDLSIAAGESVGLIGESGCGKSVTWLAALGLLPKKVRVSGRVKIEGRDILHASMGTLDVIRGRQIAMIFQDPVSALNPTHRIGTQIMEVLRLHRGMEGSAARAEARRLLEQVGIPDTSNRMNSYPHELSGGQNQRVMISMALAGRPKILVADEPTTALDVTIQAQILKLLRDIQKDTGMALVLISHDLGVIAEICTRACVMYAGKIVEQAMISDLFSAPRHPYTHGLLAALPSLAGPRRRLVSIPGNVPLPEDLRTGCAFAPRCTQRVEACEHGEPALKPLSSLQRRGQSVACIRLDDRNLVEDAA